MLMSPCGWYRFIVSPTMAAHLVVADAGAQAQVVHGDQDAPLDGLSPSRTSGRARLTMTLMAYVR